MQPRDPKLVYFFFLFVSRGEKKEAAEAAAKRSGIDSWMDLPAGSQVWELSEVRGFAAFGAFPSPSQEPSGNISSADVRASGRLASAENADRVAAPAPQCAPLTLFFPRFIEPAASGN